MCAFLSASGSGLVKDLHLGEKEVHTPWPAKSAGGGQDARAIVKVVRDLIDCCMSYSGGFLRSLYVTVSARGR